MNADESLNVQLLMRDFELVAVCHCGQFVPITPAEEKELISRLVCLECDSFPFDNPDFC